MHIPLSSDPDAAHTASALWEAVFKHAGWGVAIGEPDGRRLIRVNRAFANMHGYGETELRGQPTISIFAPEVHADLPQHFARVGQLGRYVFESLHQRKDGSVFPVLIDASVVLNERGEADFRVVNVQDISEQKKVERALLQTQQQLRALSAHHEQVLENERKRIASEVHDELGQLLTALKMDISLLDMKFGDQPEIRRATTDMRSLVERTIAVVRHVATNLRPGALDLGLVAAIEWLAEDFRLRWEIPCTLDLSDEDGLAVANDHLATAVFRIVQESLTNIARHARARNVSIALAYRDGTLSLVVSDDGVGFDARAVTPRTGFGLLGIRERVLALQGELRIESQPGRGTRMHIQLPLKTSTT